MASFLEASGLAPVKRSSVRVLVEGVEHELQPLNGADALEIERLLPRPAWPVKKAPGGSLAPNVPIERTDPEWVAFEADMAANRYAVRCASIVLAKARAMGGPMTCAEAVAHGRELGERWTERQVADAYAVIEGVAAVPTPADLAAAEATLIRRLAPGEHVGGPTAEEVAAADEGSSGADGRPWSLGRYRHSLGYLVRRACELQNYKPVEFAGLDPAERSASLAYARIRIAEEHAAIGALAAGRAAAR